MSQNARILQLTDLHLPKPGQLFDEIDSYAHFESVLLHAKPTPNDLLLISGDICAWDAEPETYTWLNKRLGALSCPALVLPGNHDDSEMMADEFKYPGRVPSEKIYGAVEFAGFDLVYMDTAQEWVCDEQMRWLSSLAPQNPRLLFIHHPPTSTLSKAMDTRYPLRNRDEVWPVLTRIPGLQAVFCGHYHVHDHQVRDNIQVFVTASTAYQIFDDENAEKRRRHENHPGYRIITLETGKGFTTDAILMKELSKETESE